MQNAIITLGVFLGVSVVALIGLLIYFLLIKKPKQPIQGLDHSDDDSLKIDRANDAILMNEIDQKITQITNLSKEELKEWILSNYSEKFKNDLANEYKSLRDEFDQTYKEQANKILLNAISRTPEFLGGNFSVTSVLLEDEELKPRIIGRDGRNKKVFETLTGVDLIIDKDSSYINLSSLNQIRREIARNLLIKLIEIKYIDPLKIENLYHEQVEEFKIKTTEIGRQTIEDQLKVYTLNPKIYYYVGLLKYRSSYTQNNLSHSLECAYIAVEIARELGLDEQKAKMCAFFHDIGKAIDFEIDKDHVEAGIQIAKECELGELVEHAIHAHHGAVLPNNEYAVITKIADVISASRPGARIDSYEEYFQRVSRLEEICKSFSDVKSAYVLRSGRHLNVFVKKTIKTEADLDYLTYQIKEKIENDEQVKNYKIIIQVIQEIKKQVETNPPRIKCYH